MTDQKLAQRAKAWLCARWECHGARVPLRHVSWLPVFSLVHVLSACGEDSTTPRDRSEATSPASSDDDSKSNAPADDAAASAHDGGTPAPTGPLFSVQACPGVSEIAVPSHLGSCDGDFRCGQESHCFPTQGWNAGLLANAPDCAAGKCLPDRVFAAQGRIAFRPCEGSGGAGVCIPQCLALMRNVFSAFFRRGEAGCGAEEVCIPCANPLDGSPTGACNDLCAAGN